MNAKVSGSKVVVTCDPAFAGKTISCSKDGTTLTQVCPSTSPYTVTFEGLDVGIWTISGIIQGVTFTTTAEVQDVSAVLSYGFVWTTWVDTASQLDSTDYSTLDELLADEEAVRELMLEHACVDYLSSFNSVTPNLEKVIENDLCAKWVNNSDYALDNMYANAAIKTAMDTADKYGYGEWVITDDTTTPVTWGPKGNVPVMTANTAPYGTASAYQVFDRSYSTTASGTDFSYKFTNPVCPKAFICNNASGVSLGGTLQGSNDGSTWTDISTPSSNTDYYLYLRVHHSSSVTAAEVQFYGRSLSVSVPTMTSNTAPYGEASTSASGNAYTVFDGNDSGGMETSLMSNLYVQYKFTDKQIINKVKYKIQNFTPSRIVILASDDDNTFTQVYEETSPSSVDGIISFSNNTAYKIWRAHFYYGSGGYMRIYTLQFYGLDYSEKEFEVGTTKKWLYDHGVELETLTTHSKNGGTATAESYYYDIWGGSSSSSGGIGATLDLTPYNLFRAKIEDVLVTGICLACGSNNTGTNIYSLANATFAVGNGNLPSNMSVDISSINQSAYINTYYSTNGRFHVTEMWLE